MDLLGTKKIAALVEKASGRALDLSEETLQKLGEELDAAGVLLGEVTELIRDIDAIVDEVPEDWKKVVKAILELAGKGVAGVGHYGALAQKLSSLVAAVRDGQWVEVDRLSFGGELQISGRMRLVKE